MTEIANGLSSILSSPRVYELWTHIVGGRRAYDDLLRRHVRARPGDAILDIGCGPAPILASLPKGVAYTGFDPSEAYIARARARFGPRATFIAASVADPPALPRSHFDIALALGVLHHLDDAAAEQALRLAYAALKPGGRFISFDPVLDVPGQSRLARFVICQDRGQNVRREAEYLALVRAPFGDVRSSIRHDLIRIPYTHLVLECRKDLDGGR